MRIGNFRTGAGGHGKKFWGHDSGTQAVFPALLPACESLFFPWSYRTLVRTVRITLEPRRSVERGGTQKPEKIRCRFGSESTGQERRYTLVMLKPHRMASFQPQCDFYCHSFCTMLEVIADRVSPPEWLMGFPSQKKSHTGRYSRSVWLLIYGFVKC